MGYRDFQKQLAPPWLRGAKGEAFLQALGDAKDSLVDRAKRAVKARMPLLAPPDALQIIGSERGIERLPGDTNAAYAQRVQGAWDALRWAGTPFGLLSALAKIGYPTARLVIHRGRDYYLTASALQIYLMASERWVMDGRPDFWSQFQVLLPKPHPWAMVGLLDEFVTGDCTAVPGGRPNGTWGVTVTCTTGGTLASGAARLTVELDDGLGGGDSVTGVPVLRHGIVSADLLFGFASGVEFTIEGSTLQAGDEWIWTTGVFPNEATSQDVERIRRVIRRWKPAYATCRGIVVHTAGGMAGFEHRTIGGFGAFGESGSDNRVIWSA